MRVRASSMLSHDATKYWFPLEDVIDYLSSKIPNGSRVLEIGPGTVPFKMATHLIDKSFYEDKIPERIPKNNIIICDAQDGIPFPNKYFDFIYCRHVLEDLSNPFHLLDEMSRVSKSGYIETPSVRAEICRGIDGQESPWRGYNHHNWFVCNNNGTIEFLKKASIIEYYLNFDEENNDALITNYPMQWNAYYEWDENISWKHIEHKVSSEEYLNEILRMANTGTKNASFYGSIVTERAKKRIG